MSSKTMGQRQKTTATLEQPKYVWMLKMERGSDCEGEGILPMVFTTKEKAMAAMPNMMDEHCLMGSDWRCGLKEFGGGDEEDDGGF